MSIMKNDAMTDYAAQLPKISSKARGQLARASTIAAGKFLSPKMQARHPQKPITLRRPTTVMRL